jgi:hypothetical protein
MPHVTGGTASVQFGRGSIDLELWTNRKENPLPLRREFEGMKGRAWTMRMLTCRAWENGYHAVFANAVGVDGDTIKPGSSCVVDAQGNVLDECHALGNGLAIATLSCTCVEQASGPRFLQARRPELYVFFFDSVKHKR